MDTLYDASTSAGAVPSSDHTADVLARRVGTVHHEASCGSQSFVGLSSTWTPHADSRHFGLDGFALELVERVLGFWVAGFSWHDGVLRVPSRPLTCIDDALTGCVEQGIVRPALARAGRRGDPDTIFCATVSASTSCSLSGRRL